MPHKLGFSYILPEYICLFNLDQSFIQVFNIFCPVRKIGHRHSGIWFQLEVEFQFVDMRWEVRDKTTDDQMITWPMLSYFWHRYPVEFQFVNTRWGVRDETIDYHMNSWPLYPLSGINMRWSSSLWTWGGGCETRTQMTTWTHDHFILFRDKFAVEFQFVDMRWGVRDETTDNHMNTWPLYPLSGTNMPWSSSLWTWGGGWGTRPQKTTWIRDNFSILFQG